MDKLLLKETKQSPLVHLDPKSGAFEFKGSSFLDNAHEFYTPIIAWVKEYSKNPQTQTRIVFELSYVNTSSQRMMFDLLKEFNLIFKAGNAVHIDWLYDEDDYDLKEVGEDLLSFMEFPYKIVVKVS